MIVFGVTGIELSRNQLRFRNSFYLWWLGDDLYGIQRYDQVSFFIAYGTNSAYHLITIMLSFNAFQCDNPDQNLSRATMETCPGFP